MAKKFHDPVLAQLAWEAALNFDPLYKRIAPAQPVNTRSGTLVLEDIREYLQGADMDIERARGADRTQGGNYDNSEVPFSFRDKSTKRDIDKDYDGDDNDTDLARLRRRRASACGRVVHTKCNKQCIDLLTGATYTAVAVGAVGGDGFPKVAMDADGAKPLSYWKGVADWLGVTEGVRPDTLIVNEYDANIMANTEEVNGFVIATAAGTPVSIAAAQGAMAGPGTFSDLIAKFRARCALDLVIEGTVENTAGYGATKSLAHMWTKGTAHIGRFGVASQGVVTDRGTEIDQVSAVWLVNQSFGGDQHGFRAGTYDDPNGLIEWVYADASSHWNKGNVNLARRITGIST